jgi:hypothetical protein
LPAHATTYSGELLDIPHTDTIIDDRNHIYEHGLIHPSSWNLSSLENSTFHSTYHPLYEIDEFVLGLAELHPSTVKVVELGHSGEGREMLGMVISSGPVQNKTTGQDQRKERKKGTIDPEKKLGFVIIGAQHAREVCL